MEMFGRKWVYGVDFSGAMDAGRKVWIATGLIRGKELEITDCQPAKELTGSGKERQRCLSTLVQFISGQREAIFGIDFPFSLPASFLKSTNWEKFVLSFLKNFPNAEIFKEKCFVAGHSAELKRDTDKQQGTPFCCYNLRLYKQTYYGIQEVIEPLVREHKACFLPMQKRLSGKPWIVEICPASTLNNEGLYIRYKGKEYSHQRLQILKRIIELGNLKITQQLEKIISDNSGGDALDSVIAAFATFRNLPDLFSPPVPGNPMYILEGYVYV